MSRSGSILPLMAPTTLTSFQNFKEYFNKVNVHSLSELIQLLRKLNTLTNVDIVYYYYEKTRTK